MPVFNIAINIFVALGAFLQNGHIKRRHFMKK